MEVDTSDVNEFQMVSRGLGISTATNTGEIAVGETLDVPEELAQPSIEFGSRFMDTSTVIIDQFPFGNPGAPIPGATQGPPSLYDRFRASEGASIWAPFQSRRDWRIARWVKTHRTTSSAAGELLEILEVCAARSFIIVLES